MLDIQIYKLQGNAFYFVKIVWILGEINKLWCNV